MESEKRPVTLDNLTRALAKVKLLLAGKVDVEEGKGLLSDADKSKLDGIESGADENIIETVKVNGTAVTVTDKAVDVTVPTDNKDLNNGAGYQNATEVSTAIQNALDNLPVITDEEIDAIFAS